MNFMKLNAAMQTNNLYLLSTNNNKLIIIINVAVYMEEYLRQASVFIIIFIYSTFFYKYIDIICFKDRTQVSIFGFEWEDN